MQRHRSNELLMFYNFEQVCIHKFKHKVELLLFQNEFFNGDNIFVLQVFKRLDNATFTRLEKCKKNIRIIISQVLNFRARH